MTGRIHNKRCRVDTILNEKNIPTTGKDYTANNWRSFDLLLICATFWSNILEEITVPVEYMTGTTSSTRVQLSRGTTQMYEIYQNGTDILRMTCNNPATNDGIRIYGVKFR